MDKRLLDILCCPVTRQPVGLMSPTQLAALNRGVDAGAVCNAEGEVVTERYAAALLTQDGRTAYRVDDGIPVMLADQAVATRQIDAFPAP